MKEKWNERYSGEEFVYGIEPNAFFKESLGDLQPGKILFLGEGEGRNAVYAAQKEWDVTAYDYSDAAKEKALKFAEKSGVNIIYRVEDLADFNPEPETYEAVVLIFLHLQGNLRAQTHEKAIKSLKPGGRIILEAFEKEQINNSSGGPANTDLLYSLEELFEDFQDLNLIRFEKASPVLREGSLHSGKAVTIRLLGEKPF